jgi:ATP-dependent Clp protease ATP-binding subunit ClpA
MIAQELEVSLHMAFVEARQQRHEFITVEHLLLALLDNPSASATAECTMRPCETFNPAASPGSLPHAVSNPSLASART